MGFGDLATADPMLYCQLRRHDREVMGRSSHKVSIRNGMETSVSHVVGPSWKISLPSHRGTGHWPPFPLLFLVQLIVKVPTDRNGVREFAVCQEYLVSPNLSNSGAYQGYCVTCAGCTTFYTELFRADT